MKHAGVVCLAAVWTLAFLPCATAQDEVTMELEMVNPAPTDVSKTGSTATAAVMVPPGVDPANLTVDVKLTSALEPCASNPAACDGSENFTTGELGSLSYGCGDGVDNDNDLLTDTDDPDCVGVQGWSISVNTGDCFGISSATVSGTEGGLGAIPPGLRDLEGSFAKTEVVDPTVNGGLQGVVSAVVLSFSNPIIVEQVSQISTLRIEGAFDRSGMQVGETSAPCLLRIIPSDEQGLRGAGEPVKTAVTILGRTRSPAICDLAIEVTIDEDMPPPPPPPPPPVTGACCSESTGVCNDDVLEEDCQAPLVFTAAAACADVTCMPPAPPPPAPPPPAPPPPAPEDQREAAFRVSILEPVAVAGPQVPANSASGTVPWTVSVAAPGAAMVPVRAGISVITRVEPCFSDPSLCPGTENFTLVNEQTQEVLYGCADGMDNNGNGLIDADDPDCSGAQGWSVSVATAPCFNLTNVTTIGTAGDLSVRPPGLRDVIGGSFARTEVVDPVVNAGQEGGTSAIVLSFNNPVILPQAGEELVLVAEGMMDASAVTAPGESSPPCLVRVIPPEEPGLTGSGEPVKSAVTVAGRTVRPNTIAAEVIFLGAEGPGPERRFLRGNSNDDSRVNLADPVYTVSALFRSGAGFACNDAADANDDGLVDSSDAVYTVNYLFGIPGGPSPPAPFPACGDDPTEENVSLGCGSTTLCP